MRIKAIIFGIILGLAIGYALADGRGQAIDWTDFRAWTLGEPTMQGVWTPPWARLILWPVAQLPADLGHILLNLFNLSMAIMVSQSTWPLLMAQTHSLLWYGNLDGFVLAGIYTARSRNPYFVGMGLFLISLKPQFLPLILFYIWRSRDIRILVIPLLAFLGSLMVFGNWLPQWLSLWPPQPKMEVSISLWPWSIVLWFLWPVVRDKERFTLLATALTAPYFNNLSLISLAAFNWPWPIWISFIILGWLDLAWLIAPMGLVYILAKGKPTHVIRAISIPARSS